MPLFVPILRFLVVFLNVYETFKTLKPPPPSARRGGQPSTRAITQRKRDLKGCLAVWIVWCCFTVYERTFDRLVGIFLPFYSEIKSIFLLFLLLTRAKGAEPLFLHVLRPFIKPYAVVVDPILDISRDVGDFLFALSQVPLDYIFSSSWFPFWRYGELEAEPDKPFSSARVSSANSESSAHSGNHPDTQSPTDYTTTTTIQTPRVPNKRYGSVRSISDNQRFEGGPSTNDHSDSRAFHVRRSMSATTSRHTYGDHPSPNLARHSQTLSRRNNGCQIWHPSASVYPVLGQQALALDLPLTAPEYHSPEWRTYPAFPSAYPPTPLSASSPLPSLVTNRLEDDCRVISGPTYPPIPEDEQDYGEQLEGRHKRQLDFVHNSGNGNRIPFEVGGYESRLDTTQQDEDTLLDDSMCSSEAGLSEDDFGASLRTPHRPPKAMPSDAHSSADGLTRAPLTRENAVSSRRKTSSDSLSSGSSSLAGKKRTHSAFRGKVQDTLPLSQPRNGTFRGRLAPPVISPDPLQSSQSEGGEESEPINDDSSTQVKRQRVLDPLKRKSTVRPVSRGGARKAPPSRSTASRGRILPTRSQATLRARVGVTVNDSTIKGRKQVPVPRSVTRGPQSAIKSWSTSSSQSGTSNGGAL